MLTITGRHSYLKTCINSLKGFIGMPVPTTVLICFCERCGYGRADHPKTAGKPWVVTVRPQCCKECGSPHWNVPRKSGAQITVPVESRVGYIVYPLGFRRMLRRLHIKLPTAGAGHSTRSPRSRIDLAKKPIPRQQTFAEPRFRKPN
jgi:hypothetical protein